MQGASGALSAVLELSQPSGSGSHPWLPLGPGTFPSPLRSAREEPWERAGGRD